MKRIGIPEGMELSAVVCIKNVHVLSCDNGFTEIHVDAFTRDTFGSVLNVDILTGSYDTLEVIELLREYQEGTMYSFQNEPFTFEDNCINLLYPTLSRWDQEPFDLCIEDEGGEVLEMNDRAKQRELIARKIANRSKQQRHYFDDYDEVSPSRKIKGLWTYGRETYGLKRIFVYVPFESEIPLKDLSDLLSRIDGKIERAGDFKRILCVYGGEQKTHGAFLNGRFNVGVDQWLAALTMTTEQKPAPKPLSFNTFRVPYKHVLDTELTTRPTVDDPIIIVVPHKDIVMTEKANKARRALRRNTSWVFYDEENGWSIESKGFKPEVSPSEWTPSEELIHKVQQRLIGEKKVSEAFSLEHDNTLTFFLTQEERKTLPDNLSSNEILNFISKCLYRPVMDFFTVGSWHLDYMDCGAAMVHDLVDDQLVCVENSKGESFLLEIRQDQFYLQGGREFFEISEHQEPLKIIVAGDLHIDIDGLSI